MNSLEQLMVRRLGDSVVLRGVVSGETTSTVAEPKVLDAHSVLGLRPGHVCLCRPGKLHLCQATALAGCNGRGNQ